MERSYLSRPPWLPRRGRRALLTLTFVVGFLVLYEWRRTDSTVHDHASMERALRDIYGPYIPAVDSPEWKDSEGRSFRIDEAHWTRPLGNKVLILDIDNRHWDRPGEMLFPGTLDWSHVERHTAGMLNHYMYAVLHGYDYQYVQPSYQLKRNRHWYKVSALATALDKYRIVVFADSDALFENTELPIEWLMNHWDINGDTAIAMAEDNPTTPRGLRDMSGHINLNTGFIIAQQHQVMKELMREWLDCPLGRTWPKCQRTQWDWKHEQGAFSSFIRYDERFKDFIKVLPCMEANGYAGADADWPYCQGLLISHNWDRKKEVPGLVSHHLAKGTFRALHAQFTLRWSRLFRVEEAFARKE